MYTANQALVLASKVARVINSEVHYFNYVPGTWSVGTTPAVHDLTAVTQGDAYNNRTGDSIKPISLTVRGLIDANASGPTEQKIRLIIFQYKQENGTAPTASEIIEATTSPANLVSPKKADDRYDSKILFDRVFNVSVGGAYGSRQFSQYFKLAGHINFVTGSTSKEAGGIYAMIMSNENTNQPSMYIYSRLGFYDN